MRDSAVKPQVDPAADAGSETLYRRVERAILDEIRQGHLKPGDRLGGTDELATKWNVSPSTVRQSLQMLASRGVVIRKPRVGTVVSAAALDRGAERPGATPAAARSEASRMIALLLPDITHPEFARMARAVQDVARRSDMDVIIGSTDDEVERYEEIIRRQLRNDVYGIVMVPPMTNPLSFEIVREIQKRKVPAVTIFREVAATGWPLVYSDYYANKYLLAKHLCDVGCRRIAFVAREESGDGLRVKHYAFLRALMASGRPVSEEMFLVLPRTPNEQPLSIAPEYEQRVIEWLNAHPEVDGISCAHDEDAYRVLEILRRLGRRVPEDVAIGGEGDYGSILGYGPSTLTTVDMRYDQMAEQACRLIRAMREGQPVPRGTRVAIKGEVLPRQSTDRQTRPADRPEKAGTV